MDSTRPRMAACALIVLGALALAQPALAETSTFTNPSATTIKGGQGNTDPFPAALDVAGMQGNLTGATVTLHSLHAVTEFTSDDFLLVSPAGKTVMLLSDRATDPAGFDMTFDDAAAALFPEGTALIGGSFRPTDDDGVDSLPDGFPQPAPAEPYGAAMSALNGDSPNGTWQLFIANNGQNGSSTTKGSFPTWSLTLTTTGPPPPTSPEQAPPLPDLTPTTETDSQNVLGVRVGGSNPNEPNVVSATFDSPPVAGRPANLHVVARDADSAITGLIVDFGETLGRFAESACRSGAPNTGGTVEFDIPFTFLTPGPHAITITMLSGGCGQAQSTVSTQSVTVLPPQVNLRRTASRRSAHAAETLAGPPITTKCKNSLVTPSKAKTKVIVKAVICMFNEQRKLLKLKPLKSSPKLAKSALGHSRAMVLGAYFAHQGPREPALTARLRRVKYRYAGGENIGAGAGELATPLGIVNGWMHSKLHRANILSKSWKAVGLGFLAQFPLKPGASPAATYTANFGSKR